MRIKITYLTIVILLTVSQIFGNRPQPDISEASAKDTWRQSLSKFFTHSRLELFKSTQKANESHDGKKAQNPKSQDEREGSNSKFSLRAGFKVLFNSNNFLLFLPQEKPVTSKLNLSCASSYRRSSDSPSLSRASSYRRSSDSPSLSRASSFKRMCKSACESLSGSLDSIGILQESGVKASSSTNLDFKKTSGSFSSKNQLSFGFADSVSIKLKISGSSKDGIFSTSARRSISSKK